MIPFPHFSQKEIFLFRFLNVPCSKIPFPGFRYSPLGWIKIKLESKYRNFPSNKSFLRSFKAYKSKLKF